MSDAPSPHSPADPSPELLAAPPHLPLLSDQLRWSADPADFPFYSTVEVQPLEGIIGQTRALDALQLGAEIAAPGYNIFVSGLAGTGRQTTIKQILERIRADWHVVYDYAYVHNFTNPSAPRLLRFPRGVATQYRRAMAETITVLRERIARTFDDPNFRTGRARILAEFQGREQEMMSGFEAHINPLGFTLGQRRNGENVQPEILPIVEGTAVSMDQLGKLVEEGKLTEERVEEIGNSYKDLRGELYNVAQQGVRLAAEFRSAVAAYDHNAALLIVRAALDELRQRFPFPGVAEHLEELDEAVLDRLDLFRSDPGDVDEQQQVGADDPFALFTVHIVLDRSDAVGPPVIVETTPTFLNLFGTIERAQDPRTGAMVPGDFTRIRCGSMLAANGGYLIINATDALSEPGVWKAMKRVLLHRRLEIQPLESFFQTSTPSATAMKPQPIELNVRVIMIGDAYLYQSLYDMEEDFRKIFKINAQFDTEIPRTREAMVQYAAFVRRLVDEEGLLHFNRDSLGAVVEYAVSISGRTDHISIRFSDIADLLREASYWADRMRSDLVERWHVERAITAMNERNALWREKTLEQILEGTMLIATDGRRVGQINGLAVYHSGQSSFGKPSRITASVGVGSAGIINIDREARLSGSIYAKGSLILSGFFRHRFAREFPLVFSASVVFEQSYGGVDGDSASSTEVYALLSALSGVPIRQDLAVTGSVNQWGEIQPIGGVKEKIEGFFAVCKARGLTGQQGVLIPVQNVPELMLSNEVVDACADGRFHIYSVSTVDEGIELLTGVAAGVRDAEGSYPTGTINALVENGLRRLAASYQRTMGSPPAPVMPT